MTISAFPKYNLLSLAYQILRREPLAFQEPLKSQESPVKESVPPGQFVTKKLPVLTYGRNLKIDINKWKLNVIGLVEREIELDFEQFSQLEWTAVSAPFHCVTQWSRLENTWEGLLFTDLAKLVSPKPEGEIRHGPLLRRLLHKPPPGNTHGRLIAAAHKHDGEPLNDAPAARSVLLCRKDTAGRAPSGSALSSSWQRTGRASGRYEAYHNNGDFWKEERFWPELM